MLHTYPPVRCKPCCQHFLLPWTGTRRGERRWERQSSSAASRFSWCPGSVGRSGGKSSGQMALWTQRDQTLHTGDRMEIQVKAVHSGVEGKDEDGWGKLQHLESNEVAAGCHFESEAVKNFSFLQQTLGGQQFWGKSVQTQLNVCFSVWRCCWCHRGLVRGGRKDRLRGCCHPLSCQSSHSSPRAPQTPLGPKAGDVVKSINCHQSWGFNHLSSPPVFRLNQVAL